MENGLFSLLIWKQTIVAYFGGSKLFFLFNIYIMVFINDSGFWLSALRDRVDIYWLLPFSTPLTRSQHSKLI